MNKTVKEIQNWWESMKDLETFIAEFNSGENDRVIVIVGISYLEDVLLACLENFFPDNSKTVSIMLSHNGFVGSLNTKVNLLYTLGFINKTMKQDLEKVAQVRNLFAHKTRVSFEDGKIKKLIDELKYYKSSSAPVGLPTETTPKALFKAGVSALVHGLSGVAMECAYEKRKLKR